MVEGSPEAKSIDLSEPQVLSAYGQWSKKAGFYELPNGGYRTPTLPALAVDNTGGPLDGSIYLTWNDQRNGNAGTGSGRSG